MAKGVKTGGRVKGVPNKATAHRETVIANSGLTPLEYMLQTLRNTALEDTIRMDAAKGAAPYVHPKLAQVQVSGDKDSPLIVQVINFASHPTT